MQKRLSNGPFIDSSKQARQKSKEIDAYLKEEAKKYDPANHLMILLLGPADSGKSTVLKQMILHHRSGFTEQERKEFVGMIRYNMLVNCKKIVLAAERDGLQWPETLAGHVERVNASHEDTPTPDLFGGLIEIAKSEIATQILSKLDENGLPNTTPYFFGKISDLFADAFLPNDEDILQCRRKTDNISETVIEIDQKFWHIVDVAGQKDKRARWTSYMEKKVSGVIFVFSCAAYNQMLEEQQNLNRIVDTFQLFSFLVKNPILKLTSIIILFNKYDLLESKLAKYQIKDYLKNYTGNQDKPSYVQWLSDEFNAVAAESNVTPYIFKTTATDTKLMTKILFSIKDSILNNACKDIGM
ncbi:guanine nucleotide binding protein, alpha subunit, partial [Gorgonomyces haynaldii]